MDSATRRGPGRPPITENRTAVLEATRVVLIEVGYDKLTLEAVAQTAGLYRRYINRTWASKAELVRDALFERAFTLEQPDTGSLRTDLRVMARQQVEWLTRPEYVQGIVGVRAALRADPKLFRETMDRYVTPITTVMDAIFASAIERGELEEAPSSLVVATVVSGAVTEVHEVGLHTPEELTDMAVSMLMGGVISGAPAPHRGDT